MRLDELGIDVERVPGVAPAWRARVDAEQLHDECERARLAGARLVALWGADDTDRARGYTLRVALAVRAGLVVLEVALDAQRARYPGIADVFPAADRMQRATYDLLGIRPEGEADERKWLRHGAWPADVFPLRVGFDARTRFELEADRYPFVQVQGRGVHEIPVGPVHAGTIEPGHFRFSIVGEAVLRLEERLGYKHKGIEKLAQGMAIEPAARLCSRVSGDSTVAYAWAYAQAVEGITGIEVPARGTWLRGILLELERIHNHLGDLGYLGNDVALSFGLFQFWRLKEEVLRLNAALFGHRYLMDRIVAGGVACDMPLDGPQKLFELAAMLETQARTLRKIYEEHAGVQDRFQSTGRVAPELAGKLGLTGMAGRASGLAFDLRVDYPAPPYDKLGVRIASQTAGDVAARVAVRFDELFESLRLVRALLGQAPAGESCVRVPPIVDAALGIGWIEGWRGDVLVALEVGDDARVRRLHPHDPSWRNWPLLERAIIDNIVPDFPLINKSFNLSYSGADL